MNTMRPEAKLDVLVANTIRAVIEALQGGVPFVNVHPDNKPEGLVLCHRREGEPIGSRATDVAGVRETGIFKRIPIIQGRKGYLCDNRWDWEYIGPLSAHNLLRLVTEAMNGMSANDCNCVALAVSAQHYTHVANGRRMDVERCLDENVKGQALSDYRERLSEAEQARRRLAQNVDANGRFTTDRRRNAIVANTDGVAIW